MFYKDRPAAAFPSKQIIKRRKCCPEGGTAQRKLMLMKSIDMPPYAPTLIESTRAIGYSLETAVADIIDNSIAAGAGRVDVYFFPIGEEYIAILDNGAGMNEAELNTAMQYGSRNPGDLRESNDLGRFGLGLKTASLSQCRVLTVVSKQGADIQARRWDIDYVTITGKWSLIALDEAEISGIPHIEDLMNYESGTLVVWQKLDRMKAGETDFEKAMAQKLDAVRSHLSLVYHRYLAGEEGIKKLSILVNNMPLEPADPFLVKKSTRAMDDEVLLIRGSKVIVRPYILPHTSKMTQEELSKLGGKEGLRRQQGFYIYRNKRLLVWGTWFRMTRQAEMSKLVRIQVDIPNDLDDLWTLDIKKSSAEPPAEVRSNLKAVVAKMAEKSKRTWTYRGKKETDDKACHVWNRLKTRDGGYTYEINRDYPLLKNLAEDNPEIRSKLMVLIGQIEKEIPLNSLYVDLTNDVKIENENSSSLNELLDSIKTVLASTDDSEKEEVLNAMIQCEPFNEYHDEISQAYKEGRLI